MCGSNTKTLVDAAELAIVVHASALRHYGTYDNPWLPGSGGGNGLIAGDGLMHFGEAMIRMF